MGPSKLRNCVFLGKCSKWNLNFQDWSKSSCLGVSEPTKKKKLAKKKKKKSKFVKL